jgi:hypothetical protein
MRPPRSLAALCWRSSSPAAAVDAGSSASSDTSVDQLLKQTFSGQKKVDSGKLDLSLKIDVQGGSLAGPGPDLAHARRPVPDPGQGQAAEVRHRRRLRGRRPEPQGGRHLDRRQGFVNFQGTEYAVSDQVFQQFKAGYEQAQKQSADKGNQQSLATLGIDPRSWLTDAKNAGEAKVGDTDTIKITGGVDVNKLLDDVNTALEKARNLGVQGSDSLPEKLTDKQKQEAADSIKDLSVEIYTGKEDTTPAPLVVNMGVDAKDSSGGGATTGTLTLDFSLLDLNEDQTIEAPSGAKPFDQLLGQLGGLGLGGAGSSGSGSSGSAARAAGVRGGPQEVLGLRHRGGLGHGEGAEVRRPALTVASSTCSGP